MTTQDVKEIKNSLKRSLVWTMVGIFLPPFLLIAGLFINDHYQIKNHEEHKVEREYFHQKLYEYTLLSERKLQALENLAADNEEDIVEIKEDIETIREINRRINELHTERGLNPIKQTE